MHLAETLLIAAAGAVVFQLIGFPGGLVAGSMLAVAVAALMGRPVKVPLPLARLCFVMVGILLGAVVTPETLSAIMTWPISVALLVASAMVMFVGTAWYLHWVHGWDPLSALLGASPGSMAQVMALSAELDADMRGIAIVHVMRVLLIVLGVPSGLALFGSTVSPMASTRGATVTSFAELAILVIASSAVAFAMLRLRFPGGLMFGAMAGSAILHGTGLIQTSLPWWMGSAAVVTLGAVAGARFANTSPRMLLSYLGAAFGSFAVAGTVAASFALIVVAMLPFRIADVIVAFAPGAQDTMMVLALALHLDPIFVGAHHLVRFLVVSLAVAVAARRFPRRRLTPARKRWQRPGFDD
jgi:membrane AbrB-like protein